MNRRGVTSIVWAQWRDGYGWMLLICAYAISLIAAPALVPWEVAPELGSAARAQVVYSLTFVVCAIVLPAMVADIGSAQRANNYRTYWRAQGLSDGEYYLRLCGAGVGFVGCVSFGGTLIAWIAGPSMPIQAALQAGVLSALAGCVVIPLVVGLSQRLNAAATTIVAVLMNAVGYYLPASADAARQMPGITIGERLTWEVVYLVTPQLRIGDQASRITFGWPPVDVAWFLSAAAYLGGWVVISGGVGYVLWRKR